ncbi:MAG: hypothetical protein IBX72_01035 [Nitrospirae bacterium]|nr:hypothetical protein [Nitrospirota bacterium]
MVERIGKEEGRLLAKDEFNRAMDELKAAKVLHESGFFIAKEILETNLTETDTI